MVPPMAKNKNIRIGKKPFRYVVAEPLKSRFAFTLIELLTVIAIISLLLSILTPTLGRARASARRLKCAHNLKQIDVAMHLYTGSNDDMYPCAQDPVDPNYWLWMGRGWRGLIAPYLGSSIDANNPSVLWCPHDSVSKEKFESTSYAYSMAFYHTADHIDSMNSSADTYGSPKQPSVPQRTLNVAKPSGKIIVGEWLSSHQKIAKDNGWWSWQGKRNYLFVDGQVRFLEAAEIREARDKKPNPNLTIHGIKGLDWPAY